MVKALVPKEAGRPSAKLECWLDACESAAKDMHEIKIYMVSNFQCV